MGGSCEEQLCSSRFVAELESRGALLREQQLRTYTCAGFYNAKLREQSAGRFESIWLGEFRKELRHRPAFLLLVLISIRTSLE